MNDRWIVPVELTGTVVRLEPLEVGHTEALHAVATPDCFRYFTTLAPRDGSVEAFREFVEGSLAMPRMVAFTVRRVSTGEALGMTSFLDIEPDHRSVEIGFTWLSAAVRGTTVNPEMKLLMMRHAFEARGALRVCLKTDARNVQSQAAIRKLGAKFEGRLRNHRTMPDGYQRDTVYFSLLPDEWPEVRQGLEQRSRP